MQASTPATATGQSTGPKTCSTRPNPQTKATINATITAKARPVAANQITRACFSVGGGKFIGGGLLLLAGTESKLLDLAPPQHIAIRVG
ncbi:MAG: hypothetical protein BWX84_01904 [Verrucomicrobia bacterium ADurb.Bin118]|nr:MAG: hypothetical protein BWX84_01904 [Verrucomicrobia bacterium ADurb.Bin118]